MTDQDLQDLTRKAIELGARHSAIVNPETLKITGEIRGLCEVNYCGKYGTNWMCPPGVGDIGEIAPRLHSYGSGLFFQTVNTIEDSYDVEGMDEALKRHGEVFQAILSWMKADGRFADILPLNAGACTICPECTWPAGKPCRFPDRAVSSLEACGINVMELAKSCAIPYINGVNTVSYVGLMLFR
jgi:predicted metal-binding protein